MATLIDTIIEFETLPETIADFEANVYELDPATILTFEAGFSYPILTPIDGTNHINDVRFAALGQQGFTGHINDRTLAWLRANGATSRNINDAWHEMLEAQGVPWSFHNNDGWFDLLGALGYTGSLNDRERQFWKDGGNLSPTPPVFIPSNVVVFCGNTTQGHVAYRMDTSPWSPVEIISDSTTITGFSVDFSANANMFALGGNSTDLQVWNTSTVPFTKINSQEFGVTQVDVLEFNPAGTLLFVGRSTNSPNYVFDVTDFNAPLWNTLSYQPSDAAWSYDGTVLLVGTTAANNLYLYDPAGNLLPQSSPPITADVWSVATHPNLPLYAVGLGTREVWIYNYQTNTRTSILGTPGAQATRGVEWSHDGNTFIRLMESTIPSGHLYDCSADPSDASTWVQIGIDDNTFSVVGNTVRAFSGDDLYLALKDSSAPFSLAYDLSTSPVPRVADFDNGAITNPEGVVFLEQIDIPAIVLPGAITDLVATPGITQAALSWTNPTANPPIISYDIRLKPNASATWLNFLGVTGVQVSQIIYDLDAALYDFEIAAVSSVGVGPWSNTAQATPLPISQALEGQWNELGLVGFNPTTFWINTGPRTNWDMTEVYGPLPDNITPIVKKELNAVKTGGQVGMLSRGVQPIVQPYSAYICARPTALTLEEQITLRDDVGSTADLSLSSDRGSIWAGIGYDVTAAIPDTIELFFGAAFGTVAQGGRARVVVNDGSTDVQQTGDSGPNNLEATELFWKTDQQINRDYIGDFYECRVYGGHLTVDEENAVLGAFRQKWWTGFPYIQPDETAVPDQITNLNATNGDIEQTTITWTPPPSESPILGYAVQIKLSSSSTWIYFRGTSRDLTSQTIYDLAGNETYDVRMAAVNHIGVGPWSNISTATTTAIAGALNGLHSDATLSGDGATTRWDNAGLFGSAWDLFIPIATGANLDTSNIKKGKSFLRSTGNAGLASSGSGLLIQDYTLISCLAPSNLNGTDQKLICADRTGAGLSDMSLHEDMARIYSQINLDVAVSIPSDGTELIVRGQFSSPNCDVRAILNDGTTDVNTSGDSGPNSFELDSIFWDSPQIAGRDLAGDFYELRAYKGVLSAAEEAAVIGALKQRWFQGFPYIDWNGTAITSINVND